METKIEWYIVIITKWKFGETKEGEYRVGPFESSKQARDYVDRHFWREDDNKIVIVKKIVDAKKRITVRCQI